MQQLWANRIWFTDTSRMSRPLAIDISRLGRVPETGPIDEAAWDELEPSLRNLAANVNLCGLDLAG